MTVSRDLSKYKLDLVGVQEVKWESGGTELAGECTFFYHRFGTGLSVHNRIISYRVRVFGYRLLRRIFGSKRDEVNCIMRSFVIYPLRQV
jgi:hypothetical protein